MKYFNKIMTGSVILATLFILTSCSSMSPAKTVMDNDSSSYGLTMSNSMKSTVSNTNYQAYDETENSYESAEPIAENNLNKASNKIIYNGQLKIQTANIGETEKIISDKISEYGGYIANYDREDESYVNISVRIPAEHFHEMLNDTDIAKDNTVFKSMSAEDVTLQYSDTEAELESLKIQEERLLDYLKSAENVADMMEIENSLQRVREEIGTTTQRLKYLDNYISYSQLDISITARHIAPQDEAPFSERIKYAFSDSWDNFVDFIENFIINIIFCLPLLIFISIIVLVVILIRKSKKKKTKNSKNSTEEKQHDKETVEKQTN